MDNSQENNSNQIDIENSGQQEQENIWSQDTAKISRVSEELLKDSTDENILDANNDDEVSEDNEDCENIVEDEDIDEKDEDTSELEPDDEEEKTVVEFIEDETDQNVKKKREHKPFFLLKILVALFAFIIIVAAIFGIWNRWFRYDDKAQIVSNWQISGTSKTVVIDDKKIVLDANAVLTYTVDSWAKVINYQIGDMSGSSHYRFSWDRNQLALIENSGTDTISTMINDFGWFWDYITCKMAKIDLSPAYTKNNSADVNTDNTGIEEIISNGQNSSILLDRVSTKKTDEL